MNCFSGFLASVLHPLAVVGFGALVGAQDAAATEYRAFLRAGSVSNAPAVPPGAPERAAARSPSLARRPPASVPFSLSWCHMSRAGEWEPGEWAGACAPGGGRPVHLYAPRPG